ncbi:Ras-related protein RABC1 [Camellia lanceoleosa]|uniref:Ras-related protein RABC1 n=1 Tax=Camellia lanceoleosa TaxID=1840588 RepID=A0ACC0GU51_9ERIC|nr:Ras-related protein RABC1 [Camellia lanceoleosa]
MLLKFEIHVYSSFSGLWCFYRIASMDSTMGTQEYEENYKEHKRERRNRKELAIPTESKLQLAFQESERDVTKKEGINFARKYGCLFIECSAKTRVNVQQCFEELILKWQGRTGLMVSAYLVYSGMSAEEALQVYAHKRTTNNEGVPYITTALMDAKLGTEGCKDLFDWLSRQLSGLSNFPDAGTMTSKVQLEGFLAKEFPSLLFR